MRLVPLRGATMGSATCLHQCRLWIKSPCATEHAACVVLCMGCALVESVALMSSGHSCTLGAKHLR
jgi:hypothetical protein